MKEDLAFAEVIDSSVIGWTAQCWDWKKSPTFGSLVTIREDDIIRFGIVSNIKTESSDNNRMPFAYQKNSMHQKFYELCELILRL